MKNLFIGVDIGGTNIRVACSDINGDILQSLSVPTPSDQVSIGFEEKIIETVETLVSKISSTVTEAFRIVSIGIGIPGVYYDGKIILCPNIQDINVPRLIAHFKTKNIPLALLNDVKCAALGEKWKGCASDCNDFIYLNIGTGLSMALILNGAVYPGNNSCSGEIGYWISDVGSTVGYSGDRAPLEEKFSGRWLTEYVKNELQRTEYKDWPLSKDSIRTKDIFSEYAKGNTAVTTIINDCFRYIATMLANTCILINPALVVFGGGISNDLACFLEPLGEYLAKTVPFPPALAISTMGGKAGIYGAIKLAINISSSERSSINE